MPHKALGDVTVLVLNMWDKSKIKIKILWFQSHIGWGRDYIKSHPWSWISTCFTGSSENPGAEGSEPSYYCQIKPSAWNGKKNGIVKKWVLLSHSFLKRKTWAFFIEAVMGTPIIFIGLCFGKETCWQNFYNCFASIFYLKKILFCIILRRSFLNWSCINFHISNVLFLKFQASSRSGNTELSISAEVWVMLSIGRAKEK